jgi:CheY-like chemotaxis protein
MVGRPSSSSDPPLVLIVDDAADTRDVYESFLHHHGLEVATAVDPQAAIAFVMERTPDVIVMDFSMPGMNGLNAARLLKRDPVTTHIPIILLTGHAHLVTISAARDAGVSVLAIKPCLPETLEAEIRRLLAEAGDQFRYVPGRT